MATPPPFVAPPAFADPKASPHLTARQLDSLAAVIDAMMPSLPVDDPVLIEALAGETDPRVIASKKALWTTGAVSMGVVPLVAMAFAEKLPYDKWRDIKLLLTVLSSGVTSWPLQYGRVGAFSSLSLEARNKIIVNWSRSNLPQLRQFISGVRKVAGAVFLSALSDGSATQTKVTPSKTHSRYPPVVKGSNPFLASQGHSVPDIEDILKERPPLAPPIAQFNIKEGTKIVKDTFDVIVVGSGAGGGPVALRAAEAGARVLVVEKAPYFTEKDYDRNEYNGMARMYEAAGILATEDAAIAILAGSALGGGTTVNWNASFRTPDSVLGEWGKDFGCTWLDSGEFRSAIDRAFSQSHVDEDQSEAGAGLNTNNAIVQTAADKLGWKVEKISRNVKGCVDCSQCVFGCPYGSKQGTMRGYLPGASAAGAQVLTGAYAEKVTFENGSRVSGVVVKLARDPVNAPHVVEEVEIRAKRVVVSCGSLLSPLLLARSLPSPRSLPALGQNLFLHPVVAMVLFMPEKTEYWKGPPMTRVVKEFVNAAGGGYGYLLEAPATHPGIVASNIPHTNARFMKRMMLQTDRCVAILCLMRDRVGGSVYGDKNGMPRVNYKFTPEHVEMVRQMGKAMLDTAVASGAIEALTVFKPSNNTLDLKDKAAVQAEYDFLAKGKALTTAGTSIFTAHQMGTCRMGPDPKTSVVNENGAVHGTEGLYVADASVFPTASGVNPMMTTMAFGEFIGSRLASKISEESK